MNYYRLSEKAPHLLNMADFVKTHVSPEGKTYESTRICIPLATRHDSKFLPAYAFNFSQTDNIPRWMWAKQWNLFFETRDVPGAIPGDAIKLPRGLESILLIPLKHDLNWPYASENQQSCGRIGKREVIAHTFSY